MLRTNKKQRACTERYAVLRTGLGKNYGDNKLIPLTRILAINGRDDVLWALYNAVAGGDKILRLWAADCAEHVLPIYEKKYPKDKRPADAIKAARQFARGEITEVASDAASATADDAAIAAADAAAIAVASYAANSAADAAASYAANSAADAAASYEARYAESYAVDAAASDAARAAANAASYAAIAAASDAAEVKWQTNRLIQYLNEEVK